MEKSLLLHRASPVQNKLLTPISRGTIILGVHFKISFSNEKKKKKHVKPKQEDREKCLLPLTSLPQLNPKSLKKMQG